MSGLRERRHAETKKAITDAAFALFHEHGFANTIMEHIADHAGVSRSTLYRRYASKEDIVLEVPRRWLAAWDEALRSIDESVPLDEAMAIGCLAVAAEIDGSRELVLAAYQALSESPALQSSGAASAEWIERMVTLVATKAPDLDQLDIVTIAGAHMGAIDSMMVGWAVEGGSASVVDRTRQLLDRLAPILPAQQRD